MMADEGLPFEVITPLGFKASVRARYRRCHNVDTSPEAEAPSPRRGQEYPLIKRRKAEF